MNNIEECKYNNLIYFKIILRGRLLDKFYEKRGWDIETGRPKKEKLEELGMEDIAKELEEAGALPS